MENGIIRSLLERRSCRSYKPEQISDDELQTVLEAGKYAPSAMGRQSAKMVVLQNKDDISALSKMNAKIMGVDKDPFYGAPTVVIVLADRNIPTCVEDGSLVLGNLMNAAHAIGLGSCWINRAYEEFESEEGKAMLRKWGVEGDWRGIGPYEYHMDGNCFHVGTTNSEPEYLDAALDNAPEGEPLFLSVMIGTASTDCLTYAAELKKKIEARNDGKKYIFVRTCDLAATYRAYKGLPIE